MNALMIGRSNVVGQPLSMMLGHRSATVAMAHSRTPPSVLKDLCRWAEIVVSATGVARLVRGEMVRPGAVVIDVGISRLSDGSIVGDVDFEGEWNLNVFKWKKNIYRGDILIYWLFRVAFSFTVFKCILLTKLRGLKWMGISFLIK